MLSDLIIIAAVVFIMYHKAYDYGYIIDDLEVARCGCKEPDPITVKNSVGNDVTICSKCRTTPRKKARNFFEKAWWHIRGTQYTDNKLAHILTTTLHFINCVLIYFVFGHTTVSLLTALLFAVNPVTNQAAIWLSGKPYSMSTMLLLLGLLFVPLMPIVYAFCVWWAPNAIFFPSIFVMHKPHFYLILLPIIGFFGSFKFRKTYMRRLSHGSKDMVTFHPRKLILAFKTMGYYLRHCLFPMKIGMCHAYLHTFGLSKEESDKWYALDRYFFLGILMAIGAVYALFHFNNPVAYGYLWFVFLTAQWNNMIMVNHPITERYMYLPLIGLMYALANLTIGTPLIWLFLAFYATRLWSFMPAYKDVISFWESNIKNFPDVAMGYNQHGIGLASYGNVGTALDTFVRGVQERPNDFRLNFNLSGILFKMNNIEQGLHHLKIAEKNLPSTTENKFWFDEIARIKEELKKAGVKYEYALSGTTE